MSTKHAAGEVPGTELRRISRVEVARIVREAELMRAEHIAGLFRSLGHVARALAARAAMAGSSQAVAGRP